MQSNQGYIPWFDVHLQSILTSSGLGKKPQVCREKKNTKEIKGWQIVMQFQSKNFCEENTTAVREAV